MVMVFWAEAMAWSMAGKNSSPLTRVVTELPGVRGGPRSCPTVRANWGSWTVKVRLSKGEGGGVDEEHPAAHTRNSTQRKTVRVGESAIRDRDIIMQMSFVQEVFAWQGGRSGQGTITRKPATSDGRGLLFHMEVTGLEPATFSMPSRRSPN